MARSSFPESWGGHYTNKDYEPFMSGADALSKPISLNGNHAMTGISANLADAVTRRFVKKVGGRNVDREEVIRPAQQLSLTMTILFGNAFETPALAAARRGNACKTTMYAVNLCPEDSRYAHAYIFPDGLLNPPTRVNDLISINDTTPADWQAEFRVDEEIILRAIGAFRTKAAGDALYAVAYLDADCSTCDGSTVHSNAVAVGGEQAEDDEILILKTTNRFASSTAVTSLPSPAESVATSIYTDGNVVLIGFSDLPVTQYGEATDPATGGTLFSNDGLATVPALDTNITVSINAVGKFNGQYIAAGGAGLAQAYFGVSNDGVTYTNVAVGQLPNNEAVTCMAVDEAAGLVYVGTEGAKVFQGRENGGAIVFTNITSRLPSVPSGSIRALKVLDKDRIAVGGESGFYAESLDGGVTFSSPAVPGATTIAAIGGWKHRSLVGTSTFLHARDVMSNNEYSRVTVQDGVTLAGDVVSIADTRDHDPNHFLAVTEGGEIVSVVHFSPYNI